jgi:hypothetical protein
VFETPLRKAYPTREGSYALARAAILAEILEQWRAIALLRWFPPLILAPTQVVYHGVHPGRFDVSVVGEVKFGIEQVERE